MQFSVWLENNQKIAWDRQSAAAFLTQFAPVLQQAGFTAQIVGSVAKQGFSYKDLDLLLSVPNNRIEDFDFEVILNWIRQRGGHCDTCTDVEMMTLPDGRIVDLWFDENNDRAY